MAGATSVRAWVALHVPALRDPRRLRMVTVTLLSVATLAPSVALTGSGAPAASAQGSSGAPAAASAR